MIKLAYPSFQDEINVVRMTELDRIDEDIKPLLTINQLIAFQGLIRRVPVSDHVVEAAVTMVHQTRPDNDLASEATKEFITWGAGPRASQNLILAAKCRSLMHGRYSLMSRMFAKLQLRCYNTASFYLIRQNQKDILLPISSKRL